MMTDQMRAATKAAGDMIELLPVQDHKLLPVAVRVFVDYPPDVMAVAAVEIAKRSDHPSVCLMSSVCEEVYRATRQKRRTA